jgi:ATP-dependent DNA helicase RecQ
MASDDGHGGRRSPETVLHTVFGYDAFKPLQREVIQNILERRDSLVVMPTGGGKSLCYQVPALIHDGLTVVVSPLISLMKDQVEQLEALGVPALFLNSTLSPEQYQMSLERVRLGHVKLVYLAPETLLTDRVLGLLARCRVDCLAIDEAHCISEWGHDFRPEYRQLAALRKTFPNAVCLALTATATPRVREDIRASLSFSSKSEYVASFNRENLFLEVVPKVNPTQQVLRYIKRFQGQAGIVYCFSRRGVDALALELASAGLTVRPYHAGLNDETRRVNQEAFVRDDAQIIVATIAFGMGINKPNVRFVFHRDLPKSLESYYQEIGRAGRDGLPAHCVLLYSYGDVSKQRYFIDQKEEAERKAALAQLERMVGFAENAGGCRRRPLLAHFGESFENDNCGMCDACASEGRNLVDITTPAHKFLSCVKRTGERFGAGHVTDVLLGAKSEKVEKWKHQELSTFGIGKELAREQWLHLARQLLANGFMTKEEPYGTLALTPKAYESFRSKSPIMGQIAQPRRSKRRRGALPDAAEALVPDVQVAANPARGTVAHDAQLFELLRRKRKELADASGVPPYVVFSDRTLVEITARMPRDPSALLQLGGVGLVKLERYGEAFLSVVRNYCAATTDAGPSRPAS